MRNYYSRIFTASAVVLAALLLVTGITLGQFFLLFTHNIPEVVERAYLLYIVLTLAVLYLVVLVVTAKMLQQYVQPIDHFASTVQQLADGNYLARAHSENTPLNNRLSNAINKIAAELQDNTNLRAMEQERLRTIVSSIGSSLLMFGRQGTVNLVNKVYEETFDKPSAELLGKAFTAIGLPEDIEKEIEAVFLTEEIRSYQSKIMLHDEERYLEIYAAPVIGETGNWLGIVVIMRDITAMVQLEQVRKDFVANVSHELKTPITSIKGFSEMLADGTVKDPAAQKEFLEIMHKESNRLQSLLEDLLRMSSMEMESFEIKKQPADIAAAVRDSLQIVQSQLKDKRMDAKLQAPEQLVIPADYGRLVQVIVNLLSNAIAYSPPETTITVIVFKEENDVCIIVKDQGIGLAANERKRIFERFYRVDRARSRESGGTGLGLSIVKHIVEAHQGIITVESEPGAGTAFCIKLPGRA